MLNPWTCIQIYPLEFMIFLGLDFLVLGFCNSASVVLLMEECSVSYAVRPPVCICRYLTDEWNMHCKLKPQLELVVYIYLL